MTLKITSRKWKDQTRYLVINRMIDRHSHLQVEEGIYRSAWIRKSDIKNILCQFPGKPGNMH